jgi:hypothetical protein
MPGGCGPQLESQILPATLFGDGVALDKFPPSEV